MSMFAAIGLVSVRPQVCLPIQDHPRRKLGWVAGLGRLKWGRGWVVGMLWLTLLAWPAGARPTGADVNWNPENGHRWAALTVASGGQAGFTRLLPEQTGINFTNQLDEWEGAANRVLSDGSGVATGDYDGDGLPDLFLSGLNTPSALYRNLGDGRFTNVTEAAGLNVGGKHWRGAVFADVDGDGPLDLLVAVTGRGVLTFHNDGHGRFQEVTAAAGTGSAMGSVSLALADVDGNGTLDLYVANNRTDDIRDRGQVEVGMRNGQLVIPPALQNRLVVMNGTVQEYGEPDVFYLNDGRGHFSAVPWTNGVFLDEAGRPLTSPPLDWGLTAAFRDFNADGAPDLYVCNDYWTPDRVWVNDGKGRFQAIARLALRNTSASSMGVDFGDLDRDGHVDFLVVDMLSRDPGLRKRQMSAQSPEILPPGVIDNRPQFMRNTLQRGRGDGTFEEVANYAGLAASDWSWSPVFLDVDLDGYEDILITAGHLRDVQDLDANRQINGRRRTYAGIASPAERQKAFTADKAANNRLYPALDMPVVAYRNRGDLTFEEVTDRWGTETPGVHHAIALADFDGDGDLDLIVNNLGSAAGYYRNNSSAPRVAVRLRGLSPNTRGIGAKVTLLNGSVPEQSQEMIAGGRYMSGSEPELVFAAGGRGGPMKLEVAWRGGGLSVVSNVLPNRIYEVAEPAGTPAVRPPPAAAPTWFEAAAVPVLRAHLEEPFDDFGRQPLLPRQLDRLGPGVAWGDFDGNGRDDLVVGGGRGGEMAVYLNQGQGRLLALTNVPGRVPLARDQTTLLSQVLAQGHEAILAGLASYEDGSTNGPNVRLYDRLGNRLEALSPATGSSVGPLAMADLDGNGQLVLFVGGRVVPGRYPEAADSQLFRAYAGSWKLDVENTARLRRLGLVSGAVWSDLEGDGLPELVLACEWGPIRVFRNGPNGLREITTELGLDRFTGRWNGVNTGDLDGDGRLDIVASNWGLNSAERATLEEPLRLYFGRWSGAESVDLLETEFDPAKRAAVPKRRLDVVANALPELLERFPTFKAYSAADVWEVLGSRTNDLQMVSATTLASTVFLNRGHRFDAVQLPREAQFAPAFATVVADFDGDGKEDLFLSQNFFATERETPRLDAGRGLLLRGDGTGEFSPVPGQVSGIKVYGEQRGAAVADFDGDGRVDLAVGQNGAAPMLFRNLKAPPGLRIRLIGPPGNPRALGAGVRLRAAGGAAGPVREIHGGSGYWSQDSAVVIMAATGSMNEVWVRWPGGRTTVTPIPPGALEMAIDQTGKLATGAAN